MSQAYERDGVHPAQDGGFPAISEHTEDQASGHDGEFQYGEFPWSSGDTTEAIDDGGVVPVARTAEHEAAAAQVLSIWADDSEDEPEEQPESEPAVSNEGGKPLPEATQAKMEDAFQTDFSNVRIHEGAAADEAGAEAFTQGNAVHIAPDKYAPGTEEGDALLGHELTHVVQQRAGRTSRAEDTDHQRSQIVEDAGLEAEADTAGSRAAHGHAAAVGDSTGTSVGEPGVVQRKRSRSNKGGRKNVDLLSANTRHRDKFDNKKTDANRVTVGGHRPRLKHRSQVYTDNGAKIGEASNKRAVRVNAGAIRTIRPAGGAPIVCVFALKVQIGSKQQSGWINIADFEQHASLEKTQRTIEKRIKAHRRDVPGDFAMQGHPVVPKEPSDPAIQKLYTLPRQDKENHATDYYMRGSGGVNLLVNLPGTDASRVGVACDVLTSSALFHKAKNVKEESVPLWEGGEHGKRSRYHIIFVYGYARSSGQKRYGWINKEMVPGLN